MPDVGNSRSPRGTQWGDRVPSHDLAAEESLLGAMLLSQEAIASAVDIGLSAGDFYKPAHGHIFAAILGLWGLGQPVDVVTTSDALRQVHLLEQVGGQPSIVGLQANTPVIGNADRYATLVADHAMWRKLGDVGGTIVDWTYSKPADVRSVLDDAESLIYAIAQRRTDSTLVSAGDVVSQQMTRVEAIADGWEEPTGVPMGFVELDEKMGGLRPSALVVLAARTSMGKSAMAFQVAAHAALDAGVPTLLFSLEMTKEEVVQRMICSRGRIDATRMKEGKLTPAEQSKLRAIAPSFSGSPLLISDIPEVTLMEMRSVARRVQSQQGLGLIVVDHLQQIKAKAENRQVAVSETARGLKVLARELNVPVLALAQVSRGPESRADKRPMLSDLRESGEVEQSADIVAFIYRDEVYDPGSDDRGMAEIILTKNRNGPTGVMRLAFLGHFTMFASMAREY